MRDVGIHPDNHLKCKVFTEAYDSGQLSNAGGADMGGGVGGGGRIFDYDNVLREDDTKIIKPS
jgi:hypothetical protein